MKRRSFLLALISAPFVPAVTSAVSARSPLVFKDGAMRLAIADIGTADAGRLRSRNGKMKINLDSGTIEILS
ncbi:hypothetical protein I7G86_03145 [Sinorhizobium meliloti]|nr:hypothetical protein [Sinorhizobium meliloti]